MPAKCAVAQVLISPEFALPRVAKAIANKKLDVLVVGAGSSTLAGADGKAYPAILVTTADTDDRVVPGHSFKYTAALQHADIGSKPHLIRIETRAGHGSGKPTDKIIAEAADKYAFAARWTGLDVE